jgi:hypothetical protein
MSEPKEPTKEQLGRTLNHLWAFWIKNTKAAGSIQRDVMNQVEAIRRLIEQGRPRVSRKDLKSILGEGFHSGFRKAIDCDGAHEIWVLISKLPDEEWDSILEWVLYGLIPWLKGAGVEIERRRKNENKNH